MNGKSCWLLIVGALLLASQFAHAQSVILVPSQRTLQQAIDEIGDGGVIEIAQGEYASPVNGYQANNLSKSFTIRAATNATVALNGSGSRDILRIVNASAGAARPISIERIIFRSGVTTGSGVGGAITLVLAKVTFTGCTFENNISVPAATSGGGGAIQAGGSEITVVSSTFSGNSAREPGGGGAIRASDSQLLLVDTTFSGNDAWESGGAIALFRSKTYAHNSRFQNNRVNLPNHFVNSLGGAITAADSQLRVSNSRFSTNQAGFAGGAIYAYGYWTTPGGMDVVVSNSTFVDNTSRRDASRPGTGSTYAGAIQMEDFAHLRVYGSRFINNSSESGGAIASFRSNVEVYDSAFLGNFTTGLLDGLSIAGAIHSASHDLPQETTNYPNATLTIRNSLFQGRYGSTTTASRIAGCVLATGDPTRAYGLGGSPVMGTVASNRGVLDIANSVFSDCDVQENQGGGYGGALALQLADADIRDTLFIGNDALGGAVNTGVGGSIFMYDNSLAKLLRTTFVKSNASFVGGAIATQGSELRVIDSQFAENRLLASSPWGGTAIFAIAENLGAPRPSVNATGLVMNSVFSNNSGGPAILDADTANPPYNLMQYSSNRFFPNNSTIYSNGLTGPQTVAQMNALSLHGQAKSPVANSGLGSAPVIAAIQSAPSRVLPTQAVGDPAQPTAAYVSYAWSGAAATLNGVPVSNSFGTAAMAPGAHTLSVDGMNSSTTISQGVTPATVLDARPRRVGAAGTSRLSWTTVAGTPVEYFIDQSANLAQLAPANGSLATVPNGNLMYRGLLLSQEGGAVAVAPIDYVSDRVFADGLD